MTNRSLRRLALEDLDGASIARMAQAQEALFVERKRQVPKDGLGPTIASFANTLGGWLLLGVDDDGTVSGFAPPGRTDLQDYVRDKLRGEIDPLPAFVAKQAEHEGTSIGLVRVAESTDTPHITATGAIYVRLPGGKQPLTDHRAVMDLARRGEAADARARERLVTLELINAALATPDHIPGDEPGTDPGPALEWILRAAPLTVTGGYANSALSEAAARAASGWASELLGPIPNAPPHHMQLLVDAKARGMVVTATQIGSTDHATVALDAGGVVAARRAYRREERFLHTPGVKDDEILPLLRCTHSALLALRGTGRVAVRLELRGGRDMLVRNQSDGGTLLSDSFFASDYVAVPADEDELDTIAERWAREIGREAGLPLWQS